MPRGRPPWTERDPTADRLQVWRRRALARLLWESFERLDAWRWERWAKLDATTARRFARILRALRELAIEVDPEHADRPWWRR